MKDINQEQDAIKLSQEQTEMVREAIESKLRGEPCYTSEEVLAFARAKVKAWLPDQSA